MVESLNLRDLAWGIAAVLQVTLLVLIARRVLYRVHPRFSAYILATFVQSVIAAWAARHWGGESIQYFDIAWGLQALVICTRWFAVMEVARRVLGAYSGIWRLTSTILFVLGVTALVYSIAAAQHGWADVVLSADRALELSIATFVVAMLAFARYYRLPMTNLERQLTIGFCLFSCSWVISNSIFQLAQNPSAPWWEFVQILAFCATLAIWILAVRKPVVVAAPNVLPTLAPDQYAELSHQVNSRLHQLNERLDHLFNPEDPRA